MNMTRENLSQQWEEKISKPELFKKVDDNKLVVLDAYPDFNEEQAEDRAVIMTMLELKRLASIPSTQFRGFVIAENDVVDMQTININKAMKEYQDNSEKAIRENKIAIIDGQVVAIDNREFFDIERKKKNPGFRKAWNENQFKTLICIAKTNGDINFAYSVYSLNNKNADMDFELNSPVNWRAANKTKPGDAYYKISSNAATNGFIKDDSLVGIDFREEVIKAFGKNAIPLANLKSWLETNKNDNNQVALVEAFVTNLNSSPSQKNNYSVLLTDESLTTTESVPGFIKPDVYRKIDISTNAKILAAGRPIVMKDSQTGEDKILFNVMGAYTYPEYVTPTPKKVGAGSISQKTEIVDDSEFT